jgi:NADPH:quinone reductase-like Zn-dependent oxidoreductase
MKAIIYKKFGPPEVLQLEEVDKPSPNIDEVLIKIHASTVTKEEPGFRSSPGFNGFLKPKNPILGEELAGEIEAVGENVTRFKVGDRVYGIDWYGAHAEYKCMPQDKALVHMPSNMSFEEAASVPNGAVTALPFLREAGEIQAEQKVLINGASGSVGTAAVQLAKHFGAEVTAVCSTGNMELVRSLGADDVVDYTREDFTQRSQIYDIIFDAVGKLTFSGSKDSLTHTGVYLTTVPTPGLMVRALLTRRGGGKKVRFMAAGLRSAEKKIDDLKYITALIEASQFRAVIDRSYPLEELAQAHRYVEGGHKKGNVVIVARAE